jgi:hypothetical protein
MQAYARRRHVALAVGLIGLALCVVGALTSLSFTLRSYLMAWLFALSLSLGSMAALMTYHLSGGAWGVPVRRYFESAAAQLVTLAVLFIPIAVGVTHLFPWAAVPVQDKRWYLNVSFFVARAIAYLVIWVVLALLLERSARRQQRATGLSAVGLLIYGCTVTFAAVDWVGSLAPKWSSTALGLIVITGQGLGAFAFAVVCAARMQLTFRTRDTVLPEAAKHAPVELTADRGNDLGNLLLSFIMTWMYLVFVQYLIIWAEDLPRETGWFLMRQHGIWYAVGIVLVVAQFAVPFTLLLFRRVKRSTRGLLAVASLALAAHWLDVAWLVLPSGETGFHWTNIAATAGIGGVWLYGFGRHLVARPSFAHAGFDSPVGDSTAEAAHG